MAMARLLVLSIILCELVLTQAAGGYKNNEHRWPRSPDSFGLRFKERPHNEGEAKSSLKVKRQAAAQSGTPITLPGGVVIPAGIFDIPDNATGTTATGDGSDFYDASLNCKCVQFYQCDGNNSIITTGEGIIDTRIEDSDGVWNVRQCPDTMNRCCKLPPGVTAPPRSQSKPGRLPKCGVRRASALDSLLRIRGDETEFGEFPWMLAMIKLQATQGGTNLNIFECGASLIHPQVALTAAHCVKRPSKLDPNVRFKIRAGEWDTKATDELLPHQDRNVTRVITHEGYNSGSLFNDVALLVLSHPLEVEDNVDTVCLPETGDQFDGSHCVATGWGREAFDSNSAFSTVLRMVNLEVTPAPQCQEALRKTKLGAHFRLNPSFICAVGRSGQDTCKGDGGGPLVCPSQGNPDLYVQVGVVSWGVGCGDATPAVYANVGHQRSWIDSQLASLGFAPSSAATRTSTSK